MSGVINEPRGDYHGGEVGAPVFRQIAEQILPDLSVLPDVELKRGTELIAQAPMPPSQRVKAAQQQNEEREATLPTVTARNFSGQASEVVLAAATKRGGFVPALRGPSVRAVCGLWR